MPKWSSTVQSWIRSWAKSRPVALGGHDNIDTAFDGDLSACPFAVEHRITGDALGAPTSGYLDTPETSPHYDFMLVQSGHNEGVDTAVGRTSAAVHFADLTHAGQGDAAVWRGRVFVSGTKPGSTSFFANPSGIVINGQVLAGADGVYLNPCEWLLDDRGYDVGAVGYVANLCRSNNGGAKGAFWAGVRIQSKGTAPADTAFCATGPFKVGADFSKAAFTGPAITLKAGQAIAFNCVAGTYNVATYGNEYIDYDAASGVMRVVVGNSAVLQVSPVQVTATQNLAIAAGFKLKVSGQPVVGARAAGWSTATGAASRATFDTSTVTLQDLAKTVKALIDDLHSVSGNHGLLGS